MNFDGWLQLIIGVTTCVAVGGVNVGWRWAPAVVLLSAPAWLVATARAGDWGMFVAAWVCGLSWAVGAARAFRPQPRAAVPHERCSDLVSRAVSKALNEGDMRREWLTEPFEEPIEEKRCYLSTTGWRRRSR